jgi:PEP-CTERM motif-containing protein
MRCSHFLGLCLLPGLFCLVASADSISPVYVSLGPNPFGSPSYAAYTSNAQAAVAGGGGNIGDINTSPTAFNTVTSVSSADIAVDGNFANWRGTANPGSPFNSELGTVAFFSVVISGNEHANNIRLSQISFTQSDTDLVVPDYFGNPLFGGMPSGSYASSSYSADHVGVRADGTLVTSGPSSQMVNKIILTSFSDAFDASFYPDDGQQQVNDAIADVNTLGAFTLNVCFQANAHLSSCGSLNVAPTPEPGTFGFIGLAFAGLVLAYRRRCARL